MTKKATYYSIMFFLLVSLAGEFGYEVIFEPFFLPFVEIHINPNSREITEIISLDIEPTVGAPYGQWSLEATREFINPDDVEDINLPSYLYIIIQDDNRIPNLSEYRIDLQEKNMIIKIDGENIQSGKIVITANGLILSEKNGHPFVSYRKNHLWVDVTFGQVQEVILESVNRTVQEKIWYGFNIPPRFCRTVILSPKNFLAAIPICFAQVSEGVLNAIPNFIANQVIFLTDEIQLGTLIGRAAQLIMYVFIISICAQQIFRRRTDSEIAVFLVVFIWILVSFTSIIL